MYDVTHRVTQFTGAREFTSGSVSLLQGRSEFLDLFMDSERPANLNSAVPACITKEYVPKVTPSYQAGHEPRGEREGNVEGDIRSRDLSRDPRSRQISARPLVTFEPPLISLKMAGESQASFSASVRYKIRETYQYRCVICLAWIDTTQCAHLLDAATQGEHQVRSEVMV